MNSYSEDLLDECYETISIPVSSKDNFIEYIGGEIPAIKDADKEIYFLVKDGIIIGFSDEIVSNLTDLHEIKSEFALAYVNAMKELKDYRRANSGERGDWGTTGLHRNVEYYCFLAEQCHFLLEHAFEEDSLHFWREKAGNMNFTKDDFKGKGGYYTEYLPVQRVTVDGEEIIFDPNDIIKKGKDSGVVSCSVEEMLSFANAGDLAYGGAADE